MKIITITTLLMFPALLLMSGCFAPKGIIYTNIRQPLTLPPESEGSPVATKRCFVSFTQLKEPISRMNLSVMWSNKVVREAAEKADISELYYSDLETLSIFMGCYKRQRIYIYGN
jgi:hypothetical protein